MARNRLAGGVKPMGGGGSASVGRRSGISLYAESPEPNTPPTPRESTVLPWSVLLWTVPSHVRLNGQQVCEALDRSCSWLHHHTSPKYAAKHGLPLLPVRKGRGGLWTTAGELRGWVERHWGMTSEAA
jgi:hypothetical protein